MSWPWLAIGLGIGMIMGGLGVAFALTWLQTPPGRGWWES